MAKMTARAEDWACSTIQQPGKVGGSSVLRRTLAKLAITATLATVPIMTATAAHATGYNCGYESVFPSVSVNAYECIYATGKAGYGGGFIAYTVISAKPENGASNTDDWFPTSIGCSVQPGWIDSYYGSRNSESQWNAPIDCAAFKANPSVVMGVNRYVGYGSMCPWMYFSPYGQAVGGVGCISV